jgi:hypothetical protein
MAAVGHRCHPGRRRGGVGVEEKTVRGDLFSDDPGRTAIPIAFDIPASIHPTDESFEGNQWLWRLEARAAAGGVDYLARFEIPVFTTEPMKLLSDEEVARIEAAVGQIGVALALTGRARRPILCP